MVDLAPREALIVGAVDIASGTRPCPDRAVRWEGFYNARDLGGLPTATGAWTRRGRLIRSADTRFITAAGWEAARRVGAGVSGADIDALRRRLL